MNPTNPNQSLIDECVGLLSRVEAITPKNGNSVCAAGALLTCRDHLTWHGQAQLADQAKAQAAAPATEQPQATT